MSAPAARPTAVVTGASRGIGRAIARRLAGRYSIIAIARSPSDLATLAAEIGDRGGHCRPLALDLADPAAIARGLADVQADVLVNNAGVGTLHPLTDLTPGEWQAMMDVNVNALYHVTRALLPGMLARGAGFVVNIGSLAGRNTFAGGAAYTATKHAVVGFSESLMLEVRDRGVRVAMIMPGSVATSFSDRADASWMLAAEDVAEAVGYVLDQPDRVLISRIEMRPARPQPRGHR